MSPETMVEKIWREHLVRAGEPGEPSILYIDLHLLHEVTSPQAFAELESRGLAVRRPGQSVATMDHSTPTRQDISRSRLRVLDPSAAGQLDRLESNCSAHGIPLFSLGDSRQGIVHVIGPELGLTQPGMTVVCGDSHTSTHGAFGALAFGIGTSEVAHVLATQTLLQQDPRTMEVRIEGELAPGVSAKDVILAVIGEIGVDGGTGHVIEYCGSVIENLDLEERMTVCNMSIEAGARAGLIAPDDRTFEYLRGRAYAPTGSAWDDAVERWSRLATDSGASFDRSVSLVGDRIEPMITWGTNPGTAIRITDRVPDNAPQSALGYMGLSSGQALLGHPIDVVFLGSCTNSRLSDLRSAAQVLDGRKIAANVRMLVVPGSQRIKREAEEEGLREVFESAGAEWREAGCSMCLAMNGDQVGSGQLAVSTSNRNFEGRQGPGSRTMLASPATAAACAVAGHVEDPRAVL